MIALTCGTYNIAQMNLLTKQIQTIENIFLVAKGKWGKGKGRHLEFGVSRCELLYIEWINSKILLDESSGLYERFGEKKPLSAVFRLDT